MTLLARRREPELMDQPDLAPPAHDSALAGLARINRWSAADAALRGPVLALARQRPTPLTLLDVACGGGDVPISCDATGWDPPNHRQYTPAEHARTRCGCPLPPACRLHALRRGECHRG